MLYGTVQKVLYTHFMVDQHFINKIKWGSFSAYDNQ